MTTLQQSAVDSVQRRGFYQSAAQPHASRWPLLNAQLYRFNEEVGEMHRALRKGHGISAEIADVYIVLAQIANLLNVDISQAVTAKLAADEERGYLHGDQPQPPLPIELIEVDGVIAQAPSRPPSHDLSDEHNIRPGETTLGTAAAAAMLDPDPPRGA